MQLVQKHWSLMFIQTDVKDAVAVRQIWISKAGLTGGHEHRGS